MLSTPLPRADPSAQTRLQYRLDAPLPSEIAVGEGTALFVCGSCFHSESRVRTLSFVLDGAEQQVARHGMPRLDLFRSLHPTLDPFATAGLELDEASPEDPRLNSYLSGFWGVVKIPPGSARTRELLLRARLENGREETVPLGRLEVSELTRGEPVAGPCPDDGPLIAVCMATYEPPMELFHRQIESIRKQTYRNWICVISDDCSSGARFAELEAEVVDDPRFIVSRSPKRVGFYLNFERALALAPANAEFIALADQDDRWLPEKLDTLLRAIGSAELVYSDARVIDREGALISDSYWVKRRNNHSDLLSLLVANSVTGAASLFRAGLLEHALPFPPAQFAHFHDHWLGLVALCLGDIEFVQAPLYDYVQHGDATLGHAAANRMTGLRDRLGSVRADPRERVRMWRLHYFVDVSRLMQVSAILQLRVGRRMRPGKRRALARFLLADRSSLALLDLWRRGARELLGRPETLGAEWMLAYAFTWRRLLTASIRERPIKGLRLDAVPPPDLVMQPGREIAENPVVREITEKVAPLNLSVSDDAPERVNLLIPTIDLGHFFGGYIGKFNLARRLAEHGHRVRIVTVDPVGPLPGDWRRQIERFGGLGGMFDQVEVAFGRESHALEVSRRDAFVATTWWTAHIAHAALQTLERERFLYLIQEYEPFTFAMGTYAALASESYTFPHRAVFSTELLREYFRRHQIGVFENGAREGDADSVAFQNAITAITPPTAAELAARSTRRLLFYARPESHASRNMFELGVMALSQAVRNGAFAGWELRGIGTVGTGRNLSLPGNVRLEMVPRSDQGSYGDLLRQHDLGLALMYTPHPSLVPIEMASAGMLAVSNSFENKTQTAMSQISENLLAPAPTVPAIARALCEAAAASADYERRARGAAVNWSRDWNDSFSDQLVTRIVAMLEI
jgi:glycosyltransferase involved in cell wall biosynthesis